MVRWTVARSVVAVGGIEPVPGLSDPRSELVGAFWVAGRAVGMGEVPAGDGGDGVVPGACAGDVGGAVAEVAVEPGGLFGGEA